MLHFFDFIPQCWPSPEWNTIRFVMSMYDYFQINPRYVVAQENFNVTSVAPGFCRSKLATLPPDDFNLNSCAWCYYFLFRMKGLFPYRVHYIEVKLNGSAFPRGTILLADINNSTARDLVCMTLNEDECEMWKLCCSSARECCRRQIQEPSADVINTSCRSTWDGFACWEGGTLGTNSYKSCPTYLKFSVPTSKFG